MYQVICPQSEEEFKRYYHFRWMLLKKAWDQPPGCEIDQDDPAATHRMIVDGENMPIAVARLQSLSVEEGQIRYMAVAKKQRAKGLGTLLLMALEEEARRQGFKRVSLNAPAGSEGFYAKCGYWQSGGEPLMFGSVEHQAMKKELGETDVIIRDAKWCQELQQSWYDDIPISQAMGIRIHQYTGQMLETRAALDPNLNLHGTMFAGSIYSLAVLTGWGLIHLWLKDQGKIGHIVLGDGHIHYHKPVTSAPGAVASISDLDGDLEPLEQGRKVQIKIKVAVHDGNTPVAEFSGVFVVLPSE